MVPNNKIFCNPAELLYYFLHVGDPAPFVSDISTFGRTTHVSISYCFFAQQNAIRLNCSSVVSLEVE